VRTSGADHHQRRRTDREEAMSFSGIGQFATDVAEVIQVDECDIVDQRRRVTTDQVTLEKEAPTTVGIIDGSCAPKAFGEIRPK
jgi:hypothetical protein